MISRVDCAAFKDFVYSMFVMSLGEISPHTILDVDAFSMNMAHFGISLCFKVLNYVFLFLI